MIFNRALFGLILSLLFLSDTTVAQEIGRADIALNTTIANFVQTVMTDSTSEFYQFVRAMMLGLAFIGLAWHMIMWATKSIEDAELVIYVLTSIIIFTVYANYNTAISEFWSWSDSIGIGIQEAAVGTSDTLFIGTKINEAINMFFLKDVSLWDGFNAVMTMVLFKLISLVLSVVVFIISVWSIWGYAFAKITGLIFLPLLFLPITRGFFDKWFQILLGFWFFNMFAKIALTLFHLYFFAIFGVLDDPVEFDPIGDTLALGRINLHFLIGIFFLIASGGLASMMASGFSGVTAKAANGASKVVSIATKLIAKI